MYLLLNGCKARVGNLLMMLVAETQSNLVGYEQRNTYRLSSNDVISKQQLMVQVRTFEFTSALMVVKMAGNEYIELS